MIFFFFFFCLQRTCQWGFVSCCVGVLVWTRTQSGMTCTLPLQPEWSVFSFVACILWVTVSILFAHFPALVILLCGVTCTLLLQLEWSVFLCFFCGCLYFMSDHQYFCLLILLLGNNPFLPKEAQAWKQINWFFVCLFFILVLGDPTDKFSYSWWSFFKGKYGGNI